MTPQCNGFDQGTCTACSGATYSTTTDATVCLSCPRGTYSPGRDKPCANCSGTIKPWEYWISNGGTSASGCNKNECRIDANEYFTAKTCGCYERTGQYLAWPLPDEGKVCPRAKCNNLGNNQYWSGGNRTKNYRVYDYQCTRGTCTSALKHQYYPGPSGDVERFHPLLCPVANCTNAANNQHYSGLGGASAPVTDACPVQPCTNTPPIGYHWSSPGLTTATSCGHSRCTNTLLNNQYYSSHGGTSPTGCSVSTCVNALPPLSYWSMNGFVDPSGCTSTPCSIKPDHSTFLPNALNLNANCAWTCDAGYYRDAAMCSPCPEGTFSTQGAIGQCTPCTLGVHYPQLNSEYLPRGTAQTTCEWRCNVGFAAAPGLRCLAAATTVSNQLTIKKFAIVADLEGRIVGSQLIQNTRLVRINFTSETTETLTRIDYWVTQFALHASGKYAVFAKNGALRTIDLTSPFTIRHLAGSDSTTGKAQGSFENARFNSVSALAMPRALSFCLLLDQAGEIISMVNFDTRTVTWLQITPSSSPFIGLSVSLDGSLAAVCKSSQLYILDIPSNTMNVAVGNSFYECGSTAISHDNDYIYLAHRAGVGSNLGTLQLINIAAPPATVTTLIASESRLLNAKLTTSPMPWRVWSASTSAYSVLQIAISDTFQASVEVAYGNGQGIEDDISEGSVHTEKFYWPFAITAWACGRRGYECNTEPYYALPCVPGRTSDGFNLCEACPAGTFAADFASEQCTACPQNTYADVSFSTTCYTCTPSCPQKQYLAQCGANSPGTCSPCAKDCAADSLRVDCTGQSQGACQSCPADPLPNQYYALAAEECSASPCTSQLSLGNYWSHHGGTNATGCAQSPCLNKPGNSVYVPYDNLDSACKYQCLPGYQGVSCEPCQPGYFASADSVTCQPCPQGTFSSDPASASCQVCQEGSYASVQASTQCDPCSAGSYAPSKQSASCIPCSLGEVALPGSSKCTECSPGYAALPSNASHCQACPPGTIAPGQANSQCSPCPPGQVSPLTAASSCAPCDAGYAALPSNATHCQPCEPGFQSEYESSACRPCEPGYHAPHQASPSCTPCPVNTISPSPASTACQSCPETFFAPEQASSTCEVCPAGYFILDPADSDPQCLRCLAGYVSQPASYACTPCQAGSAALPDFPAECQPCPAGHVAPNASSSCTPCPAGYAAKPDITPATCLQCQAGTISTGRANTACTPCLPGYVSAPGTSSCTPCAPGTYSDPAVSKRTCAACPSGSYSLRATTACIPCDPGTYPPSPVGPCVPCAPGTFSPTQGSPQCPPCPHFTYSNASGSTACSPCYAPPNAVLKAVEGSAQCQYACDAGTVLRGAACVALDTSKKYLTFTTVIARSPQEISKLLTALSLAVARALNVNPARVLALTDRPIIPTSATSMSPGRRLLVYPSPFSDTQVYFLIESLTPQENAAINAYIRNSDDFQASLNDISKSQGLPAIVVTLDQDFHIASAQTTAQQIMPQTTTAAATIISAPSQPPNIQPAKPSAASIPPRARWICLILSLISHIPAIIGETL